MNIKVTDIYVSVIINDINNGLSWYKRDDLGYGSVQEKYKATDMQIDAIKKHPAFSKLQIPMTVFNIIDDTTTTTTQPVVETTTSGSSDQTTAFENI